MSCLVVVGGVDVVGGISTGSKLSLPPLLLLFLVMLLILH